jgi:hypothetical protein
MAHAWQHGMKWLLVLETSTPKHKSASSKGCQDYHQVFTLSSQSNCIFFKKRKALLPARELKKQAEGKVTPLCQPAEMELFLNFVFKSKQKL